MKRLLSFLLLCVVGVALIGCGATPLTQSQVDLEQATILTKSACYERLTARDMQLAALLSRVPQDQVALVMVIQSMQQNNKVMMGLVTGNQFDECDTGAGAFDVQIAEIESKNKAATAISGSVLGLGKWVVGGLTVTAIADKMAGDTINAGGNVNNDSGNVKIKSGDDTVSSTSNDFDQNDRHDSNTSQDNFKAPEDEDEKQYTEDDPTCSVESRAAGRC